MQKARLSGLSQYANYQLVRAIGVEPTCLAALDPKSSASANFATPAKLLPVPGPNLRIRAPDAKGLQK